MVELPGNSLASAQDALNLLDRQLAGGGDLPGSPPDAWPGAWLPAVVTAAPQWRDSLVAGILDRWPDASPNSRFTLLKLLETPALGGPVALAGVLGLLARQARGSDDALRLLNSAVTLSGGHEDGAALFRQAAALLPQQPAVGFILARLDWPSARPLLPEALQRCTPAEIDVASAGFATAADRTREAVALCLELEPENMAAFAGHMRLVAMIHGKRDKALKRLIGEHWPDGA